MSDTVKYREVVEATNEIADQYEMRLTVRQIYYRLVSPPYQLFENTASKYKGFDRILTKARERGDVEWTRIEDRARALLGGEPELAFDDYEDYIDWLFGVLTERYYTRRYWDEQPRHVEVWVEKDALATLFESAAEVRRVAVFPSRGYSSFTKVMEAIERFPRGKNIVIPHFTDHDPSGLDMSRDLRRRFEEYAFAIGFDGNIEIEREALTIDQVKKLELPPNPTKRADARTPAYIAEYGDACWELDAIPPDKLKRMVEHTIARHVDAGLWKETSAGIKREREAIKHAIESTRTEIERVKTLLTKRTEEFLTGGR